MILSLFKLLISMHLGKTIIVIFAILELIIIQHHLFPSMLSTFIRG